MDVQRVATPEAEAAPLVEPKVTAMGMGIEMGKGVSGAGKAQR